MSPLMLVFCIAGFFVACVITLKGMKQYVLHGKSIHLRRACWFMLYVLHRFSFHELAWLQDGSQRWIDADFAAQFGEMP